jgi:malonyl-CoA/methylmalonyl-CoA synthetase
MFTRTKLLRSLPTAAAASRFPSIKPTLRFQFAMMGSSNAANMSTLPRLPVFEAIASHDPASTAVIHSISGRKFTYGDLLTDVADARQKLEGAADGYKLRGQRVAFLVENSYDYVGAEQVFTNYNCSF